MITRKRLMCVKVSFKFVIFSLLGLCVAVWLLPFTRQTSVLSDISIRMKKNLTEGVFELYGVSPVTSVINNNAIISNTSEKPDDKCDDTTPGRNDIDHNFGNTVKTKSSGQQNVCSSCFQHNFNYVIQNERICKRYLTNQTIELIVLITTRHKHVKERTALRSTWLSYTKNNTANIRYAFLLGEINDYKYKEAILKENSVYHDLIKEDFVDTYMNLTYKTIMGFKWAVTKCAHAYYVMKTDDDMFVNIPNILKMFKRPEIKQLQKTILGACRKRAKPIRDRKSKWFVSEKNYPEKSYPGFCSGTGYVTSMYVANEIYKVSPSVPFFYLEDVYVSMCIKKLGLKLHNVPGFHESHRQMASCRYKGETLITSHRLTPIMLQSIWRKQCPKSLNKS